MEKYTIVRTDGMPDWSKVPALTISPLADSQGKDVRAEAQIAYGADALYVRLTAQERDIRQVEQAPYGLPCEDSCLEFFFCPEEGKDGYFNIEMNPNGCMYLGIGTGLADLMRLVPDFTDRLFSQVVDYTEDGWRVTYAVPFSFIRRFYPAFYPESGRTMRANCYKCADKTDPPHYMAWNPIYNKPRTFHSPKEFGLMTFA